MSELKARAEGGSGRQKVAAVGWLTEGGIRYRWGDSDAVRRVRAMRGGAKGE